MVGMCVGLVVGVAEGVRVGLADGIGVGLVVIPGAVFMLATCGAFVNQ